MLTFGEEVRYIWKRPLTSIKVLYIILRYSVTLAELVYFQGETLLAYNQIVRNSTSSICRIALSGFTTHLSHNVRIQHVYG